ncbi:MAG TPA: molybdenum cofactor guanylyltransferase [Chloroflexota bacterium]|nr:molybdenum cofactor guanylyltransferase [Chloroflexota bacterium]
MEPVSGIILAGGKSRRLGIDKSQLIWPPGDPDGKTLLALTADKLRLVCDEVLVVGYHGDHALPQGVRLVPDTTKDGGPLGGLCAGLEEVRHAYSLAVATDMPFLSVPLLEWLIAQPRDYDVLAPVYDLVQTLHTVYATRCADAIRRRLESGRKSLVGLYEDPDLRVRYVEQATVERLDPGGRSFANVNTPEELEQAVLSLRSLNEEGAQ